MTEKIEPYEKVAMRLVDNGEVRQALENRFAFEDVDILMDWLKDGMRRRTP
jgi:hypothetical protein